MVAKVASKRGRGRPAKFSAGEIQSFKNIVRKNGLLAGHQLILDNKGVSVGGNFHKLTISLPTLGKVVKQDKGGKPVELSRGRPVGTTKEVMEKRVADEKAAKKAARVAKAKKSTKAVKPVATETPAVETPAPVETPVAEQVAPVENAAPEVASQADAA